MLHEVRGHNFHGHYRVLLRGPAEGFALSPAQAARYNRALCGVMGCTCGGAYGDGPDAGSALVMPAYVFHSSYGAPRRERAWAESIAGEAITVDDRRLVLVPAAVRAQWAEEDAEAEAALDEQWAAQAKTES